MGCFCWSCDASIPTNTLPRHCDMCKRMSQTVHLRATKGDHDSSVGAIDFSVTQKKKKNWSQILLNATPPKHPVWTFLGETRRGATPWRPEPIRPKAAMHCSQRLFSGHKFQPKPGSDVISFEDRGVFVCLCLLFLHMI